LLHVAVREGGGRGRDKGIGSRARARPRWCSRCDDLGTTVLGLGSEKLGRGDFGV
jgi:hypothetical protein